MNTIIKKMYLLLAMPLLVALQAAATPASLSIEEFTISAGETKEMLIDLSNPDDQITLVQFDMRLPEGLTIATENGDYVIDIADRTTWRKHSLNANAVSGIVRFLLSSSTNAVLSGNSGAIISVQLAAANDFNGGDIQLENILLVTPQQVETKPATYVYTIAGTVSVSSISLNQTSCEITEGQTFQLSATVSPSNATNSSVTWSSNNTSVATVSSSGLVTAVAPGSAVITCTAQDGSGVKATCNITVKAATVSVSQITLNATNKEMTQGQTFQLTATVAPSNATNKSVTWSSNNTSVATVSSSGLVTAVAPGSAVITCTAQDGSGVEATCSITVNEAQTETIIPFADNEVKRVCVENWDTSGDGELSMEEAAAVKSIATTFRNNKTIVSFDELQYFTGLTFIADWAFGQCSSLVSVTFPSTLTSIGNFVFYGDKYLSAITIPKGVTSVGNDILNYTEGLASIVVESGNTVYDSRNGCNAIINTATNTLISGCKNTTIPNTVTGIGKKAFGLCSNLASINIPNSVTSIGEYAFQQCESLSSITLPNSITRIEQGTFYGCKNLATAVIPNSVTVIGDCAFWGCAFVNVELPSSIRTISSSAFYQCKQLASIDIPEGVTSIGEYAFGFCDALASINIPKSVTSISRYAFRFSKSLTSVTSYLNPPFAVTDDVFEMYDQSYQIVFTTATLYVPYGTKSLYESTAGWKEFTNIVEMADPRSEQTLELTAIPAMTYGAAAYTLPQNTTEGLVLSWSIDDETVATISGNTLTIVGAGTATITATQAGNDSYLPFSREFALTVNKAMLTITANDCTKQQGEDNPDLTVSYSGFKYSDNAASLTTQPTVATTATTNSPAGTYPITVSGAASNNYEFTYVNGTLTVTVVETPPSITATDITQIDNVIYIEPTEAISGAQTTLSVKMKNNVAIQTIQFDLFLPNGVTVVANEDDELITASKERIRKYNYFQSTMQANGAIRLLAQATTTNVPAGDGEICRVTVNVPETMEEGDYPIIFKDILMVESDNTSHSPSPNIVQCKLTVLSYTPGDANNDGGINAIDFNMIGNHILGYSQTGFNVKAADISGDGSVNAIDFNMVGNIILYGTASPSRATRKEKTIDPQ